MANTKNRPSQQGASLARKRIVSAFRQIDGEAACWVAVAFVAAVGASINTRELVDLLDEAHGDRAAA